ncbi:sugar ABC transporter ATP-binding protein [Colidextribacter sp. OB.20]|uniref:sugar ABC transporter ATP-binding protein n=1 Tax=Colidextribacter sp. OB.20 TaxID=2304568 RepID=UPI00136954D4|nr:sugar ABC transporter ATP-binding protein [Colidextribacter sp. OB.20]NBI09783.1 sugar ABC transporter ATP-binding protein [Colidextribacter sp. OB.20]
MDQITLETRKVSIEFPGVKALSDVDFKVSTGEIRALVGANGAGKSTLMKVLAGANPGYTGEVLLNGEAVEVRTPSAAKKLGIQIVYQEVDTALIPTLSVAENVMLNHTVMNTKGQPVINWSKMRQEAREVLGRLNITNINVRTLVQDLSLAQKQMVLIARAIQSKCSFLILDEPTAPLSDTETVELFRLVQHLRDTENIGVIFISHRIHEIIQICHQYTVMRNGEIVGTRDVTPQTTSKEIVEMMLGRTFEENFPKEVVQLGEEFFQVKDLTGGDGKVNGVSIHLKRGEIIGIAGLVGAGKSEFCKTLFGGYKQTGGEIVLNGKKLKIKSPSDAVRDRIALVPEERRKEGVLVNEDVSFNLSAASLGKFCIASFINKGKVDANAKRYVESLGIKTPSIRQWVRNLSGGNQQKVAVGKWLAADCDVYVFDEPTKGVDVGAKQDIFRLIYDIAKNGNGVIYASCENSELLSITDRIYVMYDGRIMAELVTADTSEDEIMHYSVGGTTAYAKA